jgi:MFS family permease
VRDKVIGPCVAAAVLLSLTTGSMGSLLAVYLVRVLHASPGQVGVIFAADGVGVLAGAALVGWFVRRLGTAGATVWAPAAGAVCLVAVPAAFAGWGLVLIGMGLAGYGAGVTIFSILTRTHRQTVVPLEELPRVTATVRFLSWGAAPIGAVAVGAGSLVTGVRPMLVLSLAFAFAAPLVLWAGPVGRLRDLESTDSAGPRKGQVSSAG